PPGIESDDFDSEGDTNSTSLPEFESFHVDYPDSGDSTIDVVEDILVDVPNILPTHPTLHRGFVLLPSHNGLPRILKPLVLAVFVLRSLELQSSASLWEFNIQSYRLTFIFVHT
ncbi:hypothetical protein Tco_1333063, partial [Tanacetum coccineum]